MTNKEKLECSIQCPYCNKKIDVIKKTEIITPAEPADKKVTYVGVKATQTQF